MHGRAKAAASHMRQAVAGHSRHTPVSDASMAQLGPVDGATLRRMVGEGALSGATPVWGATLADWTPLAEIAELAPPPAARPPVPTAARPPQLPPHRAVPKPSPHAAVLSQAARATDLLKAHEANAAGQGDAEAAGSWRTYLDYVQGLLEQVRAPGAGGAEVQEQADALKAAVEQVPPL